MSTTLIIISVAVAILLFLLLREFFTWFWKVNLQIELLKTIVALLSKEKELTNEEREKIEKLLSSK